MSGESRSRPRAHVQPERRREKRELMREALPGQRFNSVPTHERNQAVAAVEDRLSPSALQIDRDVYERRRAE